jgi:diaminopimelate decarboxylase
MSFWYKDGYLYCEGLQVKTISEQVGQTPFYLYSAQALQQNSDAYDQARPGFPMIISYAVKANGNLHILKLLHQLGCWVTLVSGGELHLALAAGFNPSQMILNGNGKTFPELALAIEQGSLINIDSNFDFKHIKQVAEELGKSANLLLRINPNIDPDVHPYISTGLQNSKFGLNPKQIPQLLIQLKQAPALNLVGLHCHLGSTISNLAIFRQTMQVMVTQFKSIREQGFPLQYLNLGGGLGIDYLGTEADFPSPKDLVGVIQDQLPTDTTLILEPGRSLVGNAGMLICRVIGVKRGEAKNFIVTDGSMTELLRPSLYQAYHRIKFIEPVPGEPETFDIVGPVCESADFLGKDRALPPPPEGTGIAIFDAGAYGYTMSSNYNARPRPAEYLVDGEKITLIRRAENIKDQLRLFE